MKLYTFRAMHKAYGYWKAVELSNGEQMVLTLTTNDRAALNTGCKIDFKWVGPIPAADVKPK